ncbi:MAG: 4-hydroxythreonine-4-phosphate dehydrogenase PdxA [Alphaproteobacteria bacterium]|nr:4-hydroxythreonine-4-phosphate dehydrogenase PdxA [Alphaproteobacteria bacterium]
MNPANSPAITLNPIALTMGEPAGIGGEIALKAWLDRKPESDCFFTIDDPTRLEELAGRLGLAVPISAIEAPLDAVRAYSNALPVLSRPLPAPICDGVPEARNAPAVIAAIELAVEFCRSGDAAAMVTNPIHKATLTETGFPHPGHTEFLGALAGAKPTMMLAVPGLRVVPVTVHLPLSEVSMHLSIAAIVAAGLATARALESDFATPNPRLAVAALNPHAGESGTLGREEAAIIAPAVAELHSKGIEVFGPAPADTLFHKAARERFDAALCMYHDQALIPLKTLDFAHGVNITLGLPFVRTSPDHGTALNIAGTGKADPSSLIAAMQMAGEMVRNRQHAGAATRVA